MWLLKIFAVIIPLWLVWSLFSGEITIMNQLDKSQTKLSLDEAPIGFFFMLGAMIVMEFYLLKTILNGNDSKDHS